ncbi:MAG: ribonuclease III domain-containing protein, partial [Gammaproteobacteria bacterium]|nr:ribonuclease III domain-containing protein [Gammaproteobacteria bacterium]
MPEFQKLQVILGYHFNDLSLLTRALTHRSCNRSHNERLEFLGDALLGFLIARRIYQLYPDLNEGDLTRIRSTLVNKEALAITARDIGIGDHLYLGLG